jgi:4-amino-4-deoxy-L-arabinose transferase-like glycosyltransferase
MLASWLAFASLLVFPLLKGLPFGVLPIILGISLAVGIRKLRPSSINLLNSAIYGGEGRSWIIRVCLLGIFVRVPIILFPSLPYSDHLIYYNVAKSLAAGQGFYEGFILYPPGQPVWLAIWILVLGDSLRRLAFIQSILTVLCIPLAYTTVKPFSEKAARWACLVIAIYPSLILWSGTLGHETTVTFLQVAVVALFLFALRATGRKQLVGWSILGCVGGIAALIRPTLLALPALSGFTLWMGQTRFCRILLAITLVLGFMGIVIAPWSVRNYQMFGDFCLVSANFGSVFLNANHSESDGIYLNTMYIGADLNPIAADRLRSKLAWEAVLDQPSRFFALTFKRIVYMWGTDTSILDFVLGDPPRGGLLMKMGLSAILNVIWAAFVCAWCIGVTSSVPWRTHHTSLEIWSVSWIALIWAVHAVVEPLSRHHLPLLPLMGLLFLPSYWGWVTEDGHNVA